MDDPSAVTCEELSQANEDARDDMKSNEHGSAIADVGNANATITHGVYTSPGGISGVMRGCSRAVVHQYDDSFAKGQSYEEKKEAAKENDGKVASKACGGHVYKRAFFHPHSSHTEARILDDIFKANPAGGGKLLISIDWPGGPKAGKTPKSPCDECKDLICAASECMEIKICDENDKPKKPKCD